jgi:hypothetical protein
MGSSCCSELSIPGYYNNIEVFEMTSNHSYTCRETGKCIHGVKFKINSSYEITKILDLKRETIIECYRIINKPLPKHFKNKRYKVLNLKTDF